MTEDNKVWFGLGILFGIVIGVVIIRMLYMMVGY